MINLIIPAITKRVQQTKEAVKEYQKTKTTDTLAIEKLLYSIISIWNLHIIITVSATLYGLYLFGQYLLPIIALIGFLYLQFGHQPQSPQINPIEQYRQIGDLVYEPIRLWIGYTKLDRFLKVM